MAGKTVSRTAAYGRQLWGYVQGWLGFGWRLGSGLGLSISHLQYEAKEGCSSAPLVKMMPAPVMMTLRQTSTDST